jgi:uncharacterized protein involved in type VI secretion and phage assembly
MYVAAQDTGGPGGALMNWRMEQEFAVGKIALTDYNFEDPSMNLLASAQTAKPVGGNEKFEVYQFPGEYTTLSDGERRVKLRMQAEEAAAVCARAQSTCAAFTPGFRFDLKGHYRSNYNAAYLITEVVHRVSQDVGDGGRHSSYSNELSCMPYSVPYRPLLRTPKPLIYGVQTATVVGAKGKEIDVDSHGRVLTKADRLADLRSSATSLDKIQHEETPRVRVHGDIGIITSTVTLVGRYGGKEVSGQFRSTHIWVFADGRWRLLMNQLTAITK